MTARRLALGVVLVGFVAVGVLLARSTTASTYTAEGPIRVIDIETDAGSVELVAGESPGLTAELRTTRWGGADFVQTVVEGIVELRADCPGFVLLGCQASYRVVVPADTQIRIRTTGGSIRVSGSLSGPIRLESGSGDITVDGASGVLTIRTGSGSVEGRSIGSDTVDASTGTGALALALSGDPPSVIIAESNSGDLDITLPDAGYRVLAESGGPIDIGVTADLRGSLVVTARSETGAIRIRPAPAP